MERGRKTERGTRAERNIVEVIKKGDQAERAWKIGRLRSERKRSFEIKDSEKTKDYMRKHLCRRQSRLSLNSRTVICVRE